MYRKILKKSLFFLLVAGSTCGFVLDSFERPAYAESYLAGQFGYTLSGNLNSGEVTSPGGAGLQLSDQKMINSPMFGAKFGHYFREARWFGLEVEVFNTQPHTKQQTLSFTGPGGSVDAPFTGLTHRVLTIAPNLVFRYPGKQFQPYLGLGPGIFLARLKDPATSESQSSTRVGLNAHVGLRYFLVRHVAIFGEFKINYAKFSYSDEANLFGFKATYFPQHVTFGIAYHF